MSKPKNITVTLSSEEQEKLEYLVEYFQSNSIANVTKSDVIKFMIIQMTETVEKNQLENMRKLLNKVENEPNFNIETSEEL
jgi:hypothetical protein